MEIRDNFGFGKLAKIVQTARIIVKQRHVDSRPTRVLHESAKCWRADVPARPRIASMREAPLLEGNQNLDPRGLFENNMKRLNHQLNLQTYCVEFRGN